jgi:hypothetical protein
MAIAESPSGRIFARVDAGLFSGDADHFEPLLTASGPVIARALELEHREREALWLPQLAM